MPQPAWHLATCRCWSSSSPQTHFRPPSPLVLRALAFLSCVFSADVCEGLGWAGLGAVDAAGRKERVLPSGVIWGLAVPTSRAPVASLLVHSP